jgi:hypothetical protein
MPGYPCSGSRGLLRVEAANKPIKLTVACGARSLSASRLYASELRLMEALRLRVKDVDLVRRAIRVRGTQGGGPGVTVLPEVVVESLRRHLEQVERLRQQDLGRGLEQWSSAGHCVIPCAIPLRRISCSQATTFARCGSSWPPGCGHHDGVHACAPSRGVGGEESSGRVGTGRGLQR